MKYLSIVFLLLVSFKIDAQKLFVVTEPANNVPASSIEVRVGQSLMKNQLDTGSMYNLTPEVTWGINKNIMVRTSAFLNNQENRMELKGGGFYAKYRFFFKDDL